MSDNSAELICASCNLEIKEESVKTKNGKTYHPEHFACHFCKVPISGTYKVQNEQLCCLPCFEKDFAQICKGCNLKILSNAVKAMDHYWHQEHFVCTTCNKELMGLSFKPKDDKPYCIDDYNKNFGVHCVKCKQLVTEETIRALNEIWHPECFKCVKCGGAIDGTFRPDPEGPVCKKCC